MSSAMPEDALWFKNAVIYQVLPRAFSDSNGDGFGDFAGITSRLDYIEKLGVNAIWVQPFFPSPLRDGGYDISNYTDVADIYGDMNDVRRFIDEAHSRGIRVIFELVINHTSDQHPWFQAARRAPKGSPERNFYVWSDTATEYSDARIIFLDFEESNWTWDDVAGQYFWHRFYHHQPDLNFDNPAVQEAVFEVMEFWVDLGVDGFRLDAIPYLFEREGTTCENLPETHVFLKQLRKRIDAKNPNVILLAEANQWPEDTRPYFGDGDECHMNYNFPVMPRLYMAIAKEDRSSIIDILEQTPPIPEQCQWAMFLRNHDELTLEMVTEEERDYMWRVYSPDPRGYSNLGIRRRLAPLVENDRRRIELLNSMLLSMPGTPVLYYGDEIGMGDNVALHDRDGVRTPMQWTAEHNAGFSTSPDLYLPIISESEYAPAAVNVAEQEQDPHSLLWWTRRILALRQHHPVFGRGTLRFLHPENPRVLAYIREDEEETVLVVVNLSRQVQAALLDLTEFDGRMPMDLFGASTLPAISGEYMITLPPYGYYWLSLAQQQTKQDFQPIRVKPNPFEDHRSTRAIAAALPRAIAHRRWFGAKSRSITNLEIFESVGVPAATNTHLLLASVTYNEGEPDTYLLPVRIVNECSDETALLCQLQYEDGSQALLIDACHDQGAAEALLDLIRQESVLQGSGGTLRGIRTRAFAPSDDLIPSLWRREGSNSSIAYGDQFMLKLFRRPEVGLNPDWELGRYLTEDAKFTNVPETAGGLEYTDHHGNVRTIGLLQRLVPNTGDARQLFFTGLRDFFPKASAIADSAFGELRNDSSLEVREAPALAHELFGDALRHATRLGQRTAELHLALAAGGEAAFAAKPFTPHYQRSLYQSTRQQLRQVIALLERRLTMLSGAAATNAERLLGIRTEVYDRLNPVKDARIEAQRIRVHGDYHLEQVLVQNDDFIILDFEGEPSASLSERRIKRSPLKDVAGMLRSFDYAARPILAEHGEAASGTLEHACAYWTSWVGGAFINGYLTHGGSKLLTEGRAAGEILLRNFLIEKAAYEVTYELNNRPTWVDIPLHGIVEQLS